MAEQAAHTRQPTQADGLAAAEDDWAAALAEQTAAQTSASASAPASASSLAARAAAPAGQPVSAAHMFAPLVDSAAAGDSDIDMIMDIPVQLSVELGRTRLTIKNILQLGQGSVVELDGLAGEPMDIFVNGYLIAQGEVVVVDEKYGIRVTDIITASDRINRLNSRR
jgi:flagellar motor switch protein FliN/FliY